MVQKAYILTLLAALSCTVLAQSAESTSVTRPQALEADVDMSGIKGSFMFTPHSPIGAQVTVCIKSGLTKQFAVLPAVGFEYHIHVNQVGPGGDCMATGGHLDPANIGMATCNPATPDKCQEGDLSGKHGNLKPTDSGEIPAFSYIDNQLAFSGDTTTIVGRSVVIHNNGTRVACANILPLQQSGAQIGESTRPEQTPGANSEDTIKATTTNGHVNAAAAEGRQVTKEALWTIAGIMMTGFMAAATAV
ncbi:superoxide dismutase [Dissophora ornata]|nr:superoxide dismutase [Dissophora ornata]